MNETLPKWFRNQSWFDRVNYVMTSSFDFSDRKLMSEVSIENFQLKVSVPELAIMEMLYLVPQQESFDEAYLIMEGLSMLRPKLVTDLLKSTSSVKVKRLFVWMAERVDHPWVEKVNVSEVDFGSGKG